MTTHPEAYPPPPPTAPATPEATGPVVPDLSPNDMFESLTGFEEIAIARAFGQHVTALAKASPSAYMRALVFAHRRRQGDKDNDAFQHAQAATLGQVQGYFKALPKPTGPTCPTCGQHKPDAAPAAEENDPFGDAEGEALSTS